MADVELPGDSANGKKVFARNCSNCHAASVKGKHAVGPILGTVVGRKIASIKGYKFSSALGGKKGESWTSENLQKWLENPGAFAPGNAMAFAGLKNEKERTDVIKYLFECNPKNKKK